MDIFSPIALAISLGPVWHHDWVDPSAKSAPNERAEIELQSQIYSIGIQGNDREAYIYAGPAYSFSWNRFVLRPSLSYGLFLQQVNRHPWHGGELSRFMGKIELTYALTDNFALGASVSKISTMSTANAVDLWDDGGAGLFYGTTIKYRF